MTAADLYLGRLAAQSKAGEERVVPIDVGVAQVAQLAAALAYEHEQTATGVEVVPVLAQVIRQGADAVREERNLHFWRPGVTREPREVVDDGLLLVSRLHWLTTMRRPRPGC